MKFAIAIPQFYADGEFDPGAFRSYLARGRGARFRQRLDCIREINAVAAAGAELILFTALFDQREQMEQLAAAVLPKLG